MDTQSIIKISPMYYAFIGRWFLSGKIENLVITPLFIVHLRKGKRYAVGECTIFDGSDLDADLFSIK